MDRIPTPKPVRLLDIINTFGAFGGAPARALDAAASLTEAELAAVEGVLLKLARNLREQDMGRWPDLHALATNIERGIRRREPSAVPTTDNAWNVGQLRDSLELFRAKREVHVEVRHGNRSTGRAPLRGVSCVQQDGHVLLVGSADPIDMEASL
jgi:hypothetical protein